MRSAGKPIDRKRLLEAAESLLCAMASADGLETSIEGVVSVRDEADSLPPGLFTVTEYVQAMQMLVRCGLVIGVGRDRQPLATKDLHSSGSTVRQTRRRLLDSGSAPLASLLLNAPGPQRCGSGGLIVDGAVEVDFRA